MEKLIAFEDKSKKEKIKDILKFIVLVFLLLLVLGLFVLFFVYGVKREIAIWNFLTGGAN